MKILLTEYFKNSDISRDNEVLDTIRINQESNIFDEIMIICDKHLPILNNNEVIHKAFTRFELKEKISLKTSRRTNKTLNKKTFSYKHNSIRYVLTNDRQTFKSMFEQANRHYPNSIVVVANNDIYFDSTLRLLDEFDMTNKFLALLRYDVQADGSPSKIFKYTSEEKARGYGTDVARSDSQDSWLFKTPIMIPASSDFNFGVPGCDNRIAYLLHNVGYTVSNPALDIKSHHMHLSGIRNYTRRDVVKHPYLYIEPTTLGTVGEYRLIGK
tara:strand:- start:1106 stop:1915 length:810 start_codon:yes stop_codon:yes gene_type:complete